MSALFVSLARGTELLFCGILSISFKEKLLQRPSVKRQRKNNGPPRFLQTSSLIQHVLYP